MQNSTQICKLTDVLSPKVPLFFNCFLLFSVLLVHLVILLLNNGVLMLLENVQKYNINNAVCCDGCI